MAKLIGLQRLSKEKFDGRFSDGTLRNWVSAGKIPYIKIGGRIFFDESEIDSWISKHRTRPLDGAETDPNIV